MNINGNNGPTLKKIFTCNNCKYLSDSASLKWTYLSYKCLHPKSIELLNNIDHNKITPDFCPFLFKKERLEKIKELNNNQL